jgi:prepilin peptidase CpaA
MLILAVIMDLSSRKIPNSLVLFGLIVSLLLQCFAAQGAGGLNWLAGVAVAFACFIPLYVLRGMAAGDVKLMMAVGGFFGYPLVVTAVAYSYLAGGLMAICYVLIKGRFRLLIQNLYSLIIDQFIKTTSEVDVYDGQVIKQSVGQMPFALAIALGTFVTLYSVVI